MSLLVAGFAVHPSAAQTATPSPAAFNFGSVDVGNSASPTTVTFKFTAGGSIAAPAVLTMGAPNLDFTDAGTGTCTTNGTSHVYSTGDTCTVDVKFWPAFAGPRNGAVVLQDSSGTAIATAYVYGTGVAPQVAFSPSTIGALRGGFNHPFDVAVDGSGNVYLTDNNNAIVEEVPAGCTSSDCVKTLGGGFDYPWGVAVDGAGNIYVADSYNSAVKEMPPGCASSACIKTLGGGYTDPTGVAVDGAGNIYTSEIGPPLVMEMPPGCASSACMKTLGGGFNGPSQVAVDASGNVYVADWNNNAVKEIPPGCVSAACVKTLGGGFADTSGVAVDASGNVYVSEYQNGDAKQIPIGCLSSQCVLTLSNGFNGPRGLALDGSGNIYVADSDNSAIKEIQRASPPALSFASTKENAASKDSPQTVIVQNIGNQPLQISSLTYPTDFTEASGVATDCTFSTTVEPGSACTLSIDFFPLNTSATGRSTPLNESLVVTDNYLNVPGTAQSLSLTGTEEASVSAPVLISPAPYSTLTGSSATFSWTPGVGVTQYQLTIGSAKGASDVYNGPQTTATSAAVTGIPVAGKQFYARLFYLVGSAWAYTDFHYNELTAPTFTSPIADTTITGNSATFSWTPGSATNFRLTVGTMVGGTDVYNGSRTTATSVTLSNLPNYGGTLFAKLYYMMNGAWRGIVQTTCITPGAPVPPTLISPAPGSILTGPTTVFTWDPGKGSSLFRLRLGSAPGADDIFNGPQTQGNTATATGIPTAPGTTVYVTLCYGVGNRSYTVHYTFTTGTP